MSNEVVDGVVGVSQDAKNLALLNWIGTIFFGFIPGLVLYLVKKDDPFVVAHAKEALNWSITCFIAVMVAAILTIIIIGALLLPVIMLCNLIFCILGAIAGSKGDTYKVPFSLRLVK